MSDDEKQPAKAAEPAADSEKAKNGWAKTGVAVGIGSAAIVAALLYYNRANKAPRKR